MTGLESQPALSGKRVALVGLPPPLLAEATQIICDAEGFTRPLSPAQVGPTSDVLKPFELILVGVQASAGTAWLQAGAPAEVSSPVYERCIAVGEVSELLALAVETLPEFKEYWASPANGEELLLRCVLALRSRSHSIRRAAAASIGSTVVLADDDAGVTSIVRRALEHNGMKCELAGNGRQALELITELKPCAAVLDVHMPAIDGFEVLSRTRSIPELAQTRIILLTGSEQEADIIKGFTLGADDYVCKPFNPMELTIRLMRALGRL